MEKEKNRESTAMKERLTSREKRTDFPFNFYIVNFGDSPWQEKNAHSRREFSSLTPFSKIQTWKKWYFQSVNICKFQDSKKTMKRVDMFSDMSKEHASYAFILLSTPAGKTIV